MAKSVAELKAELEKLQAEYDQVLAAQSGEKLAEVQAIIAEFGFTQEDVFPPTRRVRGPNKSKQVEPKYRDPVSGGTWSGRGKPPKWIAGQDREKFAIK